jgi:hypothetical protein
MSRKLGVVAGVSVGMVAVALIAIWSDHVREWTERWASLAEWFVALGTLALAIATFSLARQTRGLALGADEEVKAVRDEAEAVRESVKVQQSQLDLQRAETRRLARPSVYPVMDSEWARGDGRFAMPNERNSTLVLENAGPGLAWDVRGEVRWRNANSEPCVTKILPTMVLPGQRADVRLEYVIDSWETAEGHLVYADVLSGEAVWRTEFRVSRSGSAYFVEVVGFQGPEDRS